MSWVKWLKRKSEGQPVSGKPAAARTPPGRRRKGGAAYAKEWVKVLEESSPDRDPAGTYTWELQPDGPPRPAPQSDGAPVRKRPAASEPYDTFTWELQEGDTPDDPWGLQKKKDAASTQSRKQQEGGNPYDTGVFNASWTGRFDRR